MKILLDKIDCSSKSDYGVILLLTKVLSNYISSNEVIKKKYFEEVERLKVTG